MGLHIGGNVGAGRAPSNPGFEAIGFPSQAFEFAPAPRFLRAISGQVRMWRKAAFRTLFTALCVAFFSCALAQAQEAVSNTAAAAPPPVSEALHSGEAPAKGEELPPDLAPTIASSVPSLRHIKKELLDLGLNFQVNYTGEVLGNPTGGVRQRAIYEHLLELALDGDLDKIAGLSGASFHINAYQVTGTGLSTCCIFNLLTMSSIEAMPSTYLFEAWFEQSLLGNVASIRIGQIAANTEFTVSDLSALYYNATFGWPNILAANLPSTGPNYPLATPGVRLKVAPNDQLAFLAALFNGDPSGAGFTGLQEASDSSGTNFRLRDPPLLMTELQYRYNQNKESAGLAGTIKLGAWYHFGNFGGPRAGFDGLFLPNYQGDYGVYGMIDQMLWRLPGDDPKKGVGAFALVSEIPADRNVANFYAEGGITCIGVWDARPDDMFGVAAAYSPVSPAVNGLLAAANQPVRDYEMALEATYQAQIVPGWYVQPDFQYVFHPGYHALNPLNAALGRIPDAPVFGIRTTVKF
jgi:porin